MTGLCLGSGWPSTSMSLTLWSPDSGWTLVLTLALTWRVYESFLPGLVGFWVHRGTKAPGIDYHRHALSGACLAWPWPGLVWPDLTWFWQGLALAG